MTVWVILRDLILSKNGRGVRSVVQYANLRVDVMKRVHDIESFMTMIAALHTTMTS